MQGTEVFLSSMAESNDHRQDSQGRTWASIFRTDTQLMTEQAKGLENSVSLQQGDCLECCEGMDLIL